ncbi:chemotaxis protein CheW [Frigidibacter sp. ROC022]|uniref:chemotaxis protein CheW n=1 Tax=Frigidibacter sp. ROC022 TaxID=2971796 RepID=UPI00215A206F|nr:chemotaxis protein CheW [Frigidibacter sp. ROC022]MCR8725044.1 chemotaxis protein CheW [Frigidibacter sp. ROC022]
MPETPPQAADPDVRELVTFRVAGQDFCMDIMSVREIRGWTPSTALPHAPDHVRGVINLRGAVVPIVDLAQRLGLGPVSPTARHVIIIARLGAQTVGLLVEAVSDILTVPLAAIQPTPEIAGPELQGTIEGVIARGDRMIRMVALDSLLHGKTREVG